MMHAYEAMLMEMEVGLYEHISGMYYDKYKVLATDLTWFKFLWQYAHHLGIGIALHHDCHIQLIREGNKSLMAAFGGVGDKKQVVM